MTTKYNRKCSTCGRPAIMEVWKKWPNASAHSYVCGYHLHPYKTSEFSKREIVQIREPKRAKKHGYADKVGGYAPPVTAPQSSPTQFSVEPSA